MENAWLRGRKTGLEDIVIDLTVAGFGAFIFFFAQPRQAVSSANRASSTAESLALIFQIQMEACHSNGGIVLLLMGCASACTVSEVYARRHRR